MKLIRDFIRNSHKYILYYIFVVIIVACTVEPSTSGGGGGGHTLGDATDDWIDFDTKEGSGFLDAWDDTDFLSTNSTKGNSYTLKIKTPTPGTTYTWTITKDPDPKIGIRNEIEGLVVTPSVDTTSATVDIIKGNIYDVKVAALDGEEEVATAYFTAGTYKVPQTKTIGGRTVYLEFADNFNDMNHVLENWVVDGSTDKYDPGYIKREYWRREALMISNNSLAMMVMKDPNGDKWFTFIDKEDANPNKTSYIAGGIHWKDTKTGWLKASTYGYVEARIRLEKKTRSHWDAFWSYEHFADDNLAGKPRPTHYEFDIMEYTGQGSIFDQTTHWWESTWSKPTLGGPGKWLASRTQNVNPDVGDGLRDWFYLGFLWTPQKIVYYKGTDRDNMVATQTILANGDVTMADGSTIQSLSVAELEFIEKNEDGLQIISGDPQNWKFSTELGRNFVGEGDGHVLNGWLDQDLKAGNLKSIMFVDYFASYKLVY